MATHIAPEPGRPLREYINSRLLKTSATEGEDILATFPDLEVYDVQYKPEGTANTCWYVSAKEKKDPPVINFGILPSAVWIEFRYAQYLPMEMLNRLNGSTPNWRYMATNKFGRDEICRTIRRYVDAIRIDLHEGKLKRGGRSCAEKLLYNILTSTAFADLFAPQEVRENDRPNWLRSAKGRPLEFDLHIPSKRLAIEVQGPQHFNPTFGRNDDLIINDERKKHLCRENHYKLAWMDWHGLNKDVFKLGADPEARRLRELFDGFLQSDNSFLYWRQHDRYDLE